MEHDHLDRETLERLLALDRTEDENRELLHLIAVCPGCREAGGWLLDLHRSGVLPPLFGPIDVALARSRAEAPRLWETLSRHPHDRRLALVRATRRFASWGLCEWICRESRTAAAEDPARSAELAELAVLVATPSRTAPPIRLDEVRLRWIEGRIAAGLGDRAEARRIFLEVRREFLDRDMAFDAALLSLELTVLSIEEGRTAEVRKLAEEMVEIFRSRDVDREVLAALTVFQTAAVLDTASAELAWDLAAYLMRARREPGLRFERGR